MAVPWILAAQVFPPDHQDQEVPAQEKHKLLTSITWSVGSNCNVTQTNFMLQRLLYSQNFVV